VLLSRRVQHTGAPNLADSGSRPRHLFGLLLKVGTTTQALPRSLGPEAGRSVVPQRCVSLLRTLLTVRSMLRPRSSCTLGRYKAGARSAPGEGRQGFKHGAGVPCARTLTRRPSVGGLSRCAGEAIRPLPRPKIAMSRRRERGGRPTFHRVGSEKFAGSATTFRVRGGHQGHMGPYRPTRKTALRCEITMVFAMGESGQRLACCKYLRQSA